MKKFKLLILSVSIFFLGACSTQATKKTPIAILTPVTHPSLEKIEHGFKQTLEAKGPGVYCFDVYNAQGNKTLMRSQIEEIVRKDYALVLTLGTLASQMAVEVTSKHSSELPVVFTCVPDPLGSNLVETEYCPGGYVTGIKEMVDYRQELAYLRALKPQVKTVLLVFNPMQPGLDKDRKYIECILQESDIKLVTVEVFQTNEMMAKTSACIHQADAVLVLKDNLVVGGLDVLVKLCTKQQIPLIASDLDSPDRGAALGYGVYEEEFGHQAAQQAQRILDHHILPGTLNVQAISTFSVRLNEEAARAQGISEHAIRSFKSMEVLP